MVRRMFPARVVVSLVLALLVVGGVVAAGAVLRDADEAATPEPPTTTTTPTTAPAPTTTTLPAPTTTTLSTTLIQPVAAQLPDIVYVPVGKGAPPEIVGPYEQRLVDLKFDPGPVDGVYDQATTYAVQAVQKLAGLERNGRLGSAEELVLEAFQYAPPLHPVAEPNRTEIDIAKQVITLYANYQVQLITTTSTASGETFCYVTPKKAPTQRICEVATTPNGRYAYYYFYDGWQDGDLGELFNPYYFFKGRAIHGYDSVPTEPASHGCARIPMHIATYWHTLVTNDLAVYVDGGPTDAEQIVSIENI
jgi:peptidoglycan hydrolase-like protein with peptidoglycan-binding domain